MALTVFFIECNFNREAETTQPDQGEPLEAKVSATTGLTATQVDLKIAPISKSVADFQKKVKLDSTTAETRRKKDSSNSVSALKTANDKIAILTTANIKLNDSLNMYKGALDLSLFTKSNGVITINITTLKSRLGLK